MYNQSGNENKENNHLGDNVMMSTKFYHSIKIEKESHQKIPQNYLKLGLKTSTFYDCERFYVHI